MDDDELRRLLEGIRQETAAARQESTAARQESAAALQETVAARQENAAAHAETRRHFDVALEATRHELRLVAEAVSGTREELARTAADHAERIERVAVETQSMIKFSHAELDRRMRAMEETQRTLEDALSDLQSRVERLESSTH